MWAAFPVEKSTVRHFLSHFTGLTCSRHHLRHENRRGLIPSSSGKNVTNVCGTAPNQVLNEGVAGHGRKGTSVKFNLFRLRFSSVRPRVGSPRRPELTLTTERGRRILEPRRNSFARIVRYPLPVMFRSGREASQRSGTCQV